MLMVQKDGLNYKLECKETNLVVENQSLDQAYDEIVKLKEKLLEAQENLGLKIAPSSKFVPLNEENHRFINIKPLMVVLIISILGLIFVKVVSAVNYISQNITTTVKEFFYKDNELVLSKRVFSAVEKFSDIMQEVTPERKEKFIANLDVVSKEAKPYIDVIVKNLIDK